MSATLCLNGTVVRAAPIDFIQRGTHRLIDASGRQIAILRSTTINLVQFEGLLVAVCGIFEGIIEGLQSILVSNVFISPSSCPVQPIITDCCPRSCKKSKCNKRSGYYPCSRPVLRPPFQPVFQQPIQQPIIQPIQRPIIQPIQQPIFQPNQQFICQPVCQKESCCPRCQKKTKKPKICSKCVKHFTKK